MKLLLSLCFLLISFRALAIDVSVFYAKGNVKIIDLEGNEKKALKGETVTEGEKIITGKKSFVILKIDSHSIHRVEESSSLLISKLPYHFKNSDELEQGGSFYLEVGTIFSEIFKKSGNNSHEIRTKNSIMGVRGTKFMVSKDKDDHTWLSVEHGEVEVKNEQTNHHDVVINKQSIVIENDKYFTQPKRYEWQKKLSWNIDKAKEDVKTFSNHRKLALMEFSKKRTKWTRNEVRFKEVQHSWVKRKKAYDLNIKKNKLTPNTKLKNRKLRLEEKLENLYKKKGMPKSTRELYKSILNSKSDLKLNDFANEKLDESKSKMRSNKERLRQIRNIRRDQNKPKQPVVIPKPITPVNTAPVNTTPVGSDGASFI